jgi:hypothetical protein
MPAWSLELSERLLCFKNNPMITWKVRQAKSRQAAGNMSNLPVRQAILQISILCWIVEKICTHWEQSLCA